jgi:sterol 14-demethylase
MDPQKRLFMVAQHLKAPPCLRPAACSSAAEAQFAAEMKNIQIDSGEGLPSPPLVEVSTEGLPPQPFLKKCADELGGLFKLRTPSGKERIVLTDPELFELLFYPDEITLSRLLGMRQFNERGFGWPGGGIDDPKVLDDIRRALNPHASQKFSDNIGLELVQFFKSWPDSGEKGLFDISHGTMHPVSTQLFGERYSYEQCPHLRKSVVEFDEEVGKAIYQEPMDNLEAHVTARRNLEITVEEALEAGVNTEPGKSPILEVVYGAKKVPKKWGKFGISNIWAAQGNTIPATFWCMAYILNDKERYARVRAEIDEHFKDQPNADGQFDESNLKFLDCCFKESLRLKATGAEFRVCLQDHKIETQGKKYQVKKGETLYNSSYFMHHNADIYHDVEAFVPERWEDSKYLRSLPQYSFTPFGAGSHVCAGRFLATREIFIFIALLFRDFDCKLSSPWPDTLWNNAIGVVRPAADLSFTYTRRVK